MIITRLTDGLGNQLFQYALGLRLAIQRKTTLKLDVSHFAAHRQFRLDRFRIAASIATAAESARPDGTFRLGRLLWRIDRARRFEKRYFLVERQFHFDPAVLRAGRRVYLAGYWQSERYFSAIADLVRAELTLREPPDARNAAMLHEIERVNAVSVHVRRGDYPQLAHKHPPCTAEYYRAAVARVREQVPDPHFFVFSDDPSWVRTHMQWLAPATLLSHNGPEHDTEDLRLMSHCRRHIIANSTFSWWGAWLCRHPEKIVIAPQRWFGAGITYSTADLLPPGWLRIAG